MARLASRESTATTSPSWRTGIVSERSGTSRCQRGSSSRQIRPSTTARRSCGCALAATRMPTASSGCAVGAVVGRACATHRNVPRASAQRDPEQEVGERHVGEQLPLGHHPLQVLDRAAGQLGVFGEQLAQRGHFTASPAPVVDHPTTWDHEVRPQRKEEHHVEAGPQAARPEQEGRQPRQEAQHLSAPCAGQSTSARRASVQARRSTRVVRTSTVVWVLPSACSATVTCACCSTAMRICSRSAAGRLFTAALRGQQPLQLLVEAVLGQARRALVQVAGQERAPLPVALVVEEQPHLGEHLGAVGLVRVAAAHDVASECSPRRKPRSRGGVGEQVAQLTAAAVQPRHHRADRRAHDVGDLLVREALDVGEVDRHPEVVGQLLESGLHVVVGQPVERLGLRGRQALRGVLPGLGDLPVGDLLRGRLLRLALPAAVAVDVGVGEDPVEPGLEVGARAERAERGERLEERLLHEVLGVGRVARHPQRCAVELVEQRHRVTLEAGGALLRGLLLLIDRLDRRCRPGARSASSVRAPRSSRAGSRGTRPEDRPRGGLLTERAYAPRRARARRRIQDC